MAKETAKNPVLTIGWVAVPFTEIPDYNVCEYINHFKDDTEDKKQDLRT